MYSTSLPRASLKTNITSQSWHFNSAHQIIGLVTLGLLITQLTLGVFHHMEFQRTQGPTFWSPIHLWLGRGVMLLAWINCFLYVLLSLRYT